MKKDNIKSDVAINLNSSIYFLLITDRLMDKETKNAIAISSLREEIQKTTKPQGNLLKFTTCVVYQHGNKKDREQMVVKIQISGFQSGDIEMEEGMYLLNKTHHLGFSARYEDYSYNEEDKIFTITGNSEKMGAYKVQFLINERT